MRFAQLFSLAVLFAGASVYAQQHPLNPATQILWPACQAGEAYEPATNTCAAHVGPPGGSLSYPGVTTDGANGLAISGDVAAADVIPGARTDQAFVFEGDSLTIGSMVPAGQDYPTYLMGMSYFLNRGTKYNVGVGGTNTAQITARYAANVQPHKPGGSINKSWLFIWTGENDLESGTDAATLFAAISAYWTTAKADGFTVVALTIPPSSNRSAAGTALRDATNDLIRASNIYDYLIDTDDIYNLGGNFVDGVLHPNGTLNYEIARYINNRLMGKPTSTAQPHGALWAGPVISGSHMTPGDIGASRAGDGTLGVVWLGYDGGCYIFRFNVAQIKTNCDFVTSRSATQGVMYLGSDLTHYFMRNGVDWTTTAKTMKFNGQWTFSAPDNGYFSLVEVNNTHTANFNRILLNANGESIYRVGGSGNSTRFQDYSGTDLVTISGTGRVVALSYQSTLATPATSSAACTTGQFEDDANYHYVCTATNVWKRVALTAF